MDLAQAGAGAGQPRCCSDRDGQHVETDRRESNADASKLGGVLSRRRYGSTHAKKAVVTQETLAVDTDDGSTIAVPLSWIPGFLHGSAKERSNWRFIGFGEGIHWPGLDEDISIAGLLEGVPSTANQ